ncbi:MAG: M61 family metallopeptidase [Opitutaceae bacterium]
MKSDLSPAYFFLPSALSFAVFAALLPAVAQDTASNSTPQPAPIVETIPAPVDRPYPGVMRLEVDATDVARAIYRVEQTIPVAKSGRMTLLMPEWLPGYHAPRGEIEKLAGLVIRANGEVIPWQRDTVDMHAFHIDVPAGAGEVAASFQFLSATAPNQGRIVIAPAMMNLKWEQVSLYPAGYFTRRILVEATVTYPDGWTARSGLPATSKGSVYSYKRTTYETLIDSPVFAGRYFREFELTDRVDLNVFADEPKYLETKPEHIEAHKQLVDQTIRLFGSQHYDNYEFLLALTDEMGGIGLEHHRSSENGVDREYFTEWDKGPGHRNLLPHEFVHSWNGKFRRGADLYTVDYRTPMRDSLLWVYEGQTQFWGHVLQARSGLVSRQETLDQLAMLYAAYDNVSGREWRPLIDTTNDPIIAERRPKGWSSWQRAEDYYNEGLLIWLEIDSILRDRSGGTKSMDDFARAFFGMRDGDWGVLTYTFDDIVATLDAIQPYDWARHLEDRVNRINERAPLAGLTNNGYKVIYADEPTETWKQYEKQREVVTFAYSGGLTVDKDGGIDRVLWNSAAYHAGLDLGDKIIAVGDWAYSEDRLREAIKAASDARDPIRLIVRREDRIRQVQIDYHGGLRYPRSQKIGEGENGLDRLLSAK